VRKMKKQKSVKMWGVIDNDRCIRVLYLTKAEAKVEEFEQRIFYKNTDKKINVRPVTVSWEG
jgi:hypothetical protein